MQPDDINVLIGHNLRGIRIARGMTQAQLALLCEGGLSSQQISKYELGIDQVSGSRLVEFANILTCNLIDFFEGVDSDA